MGNILLKEASLILSPKVRRNTNIYLENGVVARIGDGVLAGESSDWTVDCHKKLVAPGLANCHTHLPMTLLRGLAEDLRLKDWLTTKIWKLEPKLRPEHVVAGAQAGAIELAMCGVTAFGDMYMYEKEVADAATKIGLRMLACPVILDTGPWQHGVEEALAEVSAIRRSRTMNVGLAPHSTYSCTKETLQRVADYSEKLDLKVHIHLAETRWSQEQSVQSNGLRETFYLDRLNLIGPKLLAAHAVWLTKQEASLLGARRASTVFCPVSNMKLAEGGVSPVPELLEAGAHVGFGTDGSASNNSLNLLETAKMGALLIKHSRWDASLMAAQTLWKIMTESGYQSLGFRPNVLAEGSEADVITFDCSRPDTAVSPAADPFASTVYGASRVVDSFVAGEPVMVDGKVHGVSEEKVFEEYLKASSEIADLS
ncbi:MAG: amidohydrolase [Thermoprotei archaeon]